MIRRVRLLGEEAQYSVLSDRAVIPPWGVHGARSGMPYHLSLEREGALREFDTPGKVTGHPIRRGDVVVMRSSGGGGFGDPLERDPALVAHDIACGVVTPDTALRWYGVVLEPDGTVDAAATRQCRAALRAGRVMLAVVADDDLDPYVGSKGRHRVLIVSPGDARLLGAEDHGLVEMFGRHPAPLRAWTLIGGSDTRTGSIRLDAFGRRVLGVRDGDRVMVRSVPAPKVTGGISG